MCISEELRTRILESVKEQEHLLGVLEFECGTISYVNMPIIIEGCVDMIRFNCAQQRFDQVCITVAEDGSCLGPGVALADDAKFVDIPIPEGFLD